MVLDLGSASSPGVAVTSAGAGLDESSSEGGHQALIHDLIHGVLALVHACPL